MHLGETKFTSLLHYFIIGAYGNTAALFYKIFFGEWFNLYLDSMDSSKLINLDNTRGVNKRGI